jgi:DNA-binding transcriptional regulator PaaX
LFKQAVLATLAVGGVLVVGAMAPNIFKAIPRSLLKKIGGGRKGSIANAVAKLKKENLIAIEFVGGKKVLHITAAGRKRLQVYERRVPKVPRRWDGKWRVVIFDIREKRKLVRDALRRSLNEIGFFKLQHSVWAYPYPCEELFALLKTELQVGKEVLYMVVEELEGDSVMRAHFKL